MGGPRRRTSAPFGGNADDGDIDVVVRRLNGPVRVLCDDRTGGGEWLIVQLTDTPAGPMCGHAIVAAVCNRHNPHKGRRIVDCGSD